MSGFDSDSIARFQDMGLSAEHQEQMRELIARVDAWRAEDELEQASEHVSGLISALERPPAQTPDEPIDAGNKLSHQDKRLWSGALYFLRADLKLDIGQAEEALEDADAALEAGWRTREAFNLAGWANFAADRPALARDHYDRALARDPDMISALMGRALALMELEDFDHARSDLTHALNLDTSDAELFALRSDVFVRAGQLDQAARDIEQARELEDEPEYALQHARLLVILGRAAEAEEVLGAAIEGADELVSDALLLRSHLRLSAGRIAQARADAIRASNNFPDEAFAFVQLAHVQLVARKSSSALKAAERAVQLDPSLADAYMVRAAARHLAGMERESREDFERAHQAPAELPEFLLGPGFGLADAREFGRGLEQIFQEPIRPKPAPKAKPKKRAPSKPKSAQPEREKPRPPKTKAEEPAATGSVPPGMPPGLGNFDPVSLLGEVFDDSGRMKKRFKPFLEMAMKNAPSILKKMPPGLFPKVEGFDPEDLEKLDFSELSPEQIEEQMRQFYQQMQSGNNPFDQGADGPNSGASDDK